MNSEYESSDEVCLIKLSRKSSLLESLEIVPQTDTGRWDEYSKVIERTAAKELGKMNP